MDNSQKPAVLEAVEELRATATNPEEHAQVDAWEAEATAERAKALADLGHTSASELVQLQDGSIVTKETVVAERKAGHDSSLVYDQNRRA